MAKTKTQIKINSEVKDVLEDKARYNKSLSNYIEIIMSDWIDGNVNLPNEFTCKMVFDESINVTLNSEIYEKFNSKVQHSLYPNRAKVLELLILNK